MNNAVSEQLRNLDLIRNGRVNRTRVEKLSPTQIIDIANESLELTSAGQCARDSAPFSYTASLTLSGERWPCSALECRQKRIQESAYFAALFCDKLYLRNSIANCAHSSRHDSCRDSDGFKQLLCDDISLFLEVEPLIKEGIIHLVSPPNYCPKCLSPRGVLSSAQRTMLARCNRNLEARFIADGKLSLSYEGKEFHLHASGPVELLHDGSLHQRTPKPPYRLEQRPSILARVRRGETVVLDNRVRSLIGYDAHLAQMVTRSVMFQLACSQCLDTGYLSENPLELDVIRSMSGERQMHATEDALLSALTSEIPFIHGLAPAELVKMRKREGDSYQLFRKALRDAVREYVSSEKPLSKKDTRQLYADVVAPELAKVEIALKSARRRALKSAGSKLVGWTAAISASAYAGFLPASLTAAAGALGFTKIAADLLSDAIHRGDVMEDVRKENMFFLWNVRRKAPKGAKHALD